MILTSYQRGKDREKVEKIIGHSLKTTEQVHHHTNNTLVVCEDQTYHMLLHRRTKALKVCGHANWRRCRYCKKYDSPENLWIDKYDRHWEHPECQALRGQIQKLSRHTEIQLVGRLQKV